jgi:hypothetical protein
MLLALCVVCVTACSEGATLVRESPQGGVVTYLYWDDRGGPMFSRHRSEALEIIASKCPSGYSIAQQAEAKAYSTVQGTIEGTEDESRAHRWGLQFRCKSKTAER